VTEALGVSQQTLPSYKVGRWRIPVSALPVVAHTLSVSLDANCPNPTRLTCCRARCCALTKRR
jgi:hypothetical protein